MFPLGDDNHGARGVPLVTIALVAINSLVFLYQMGLPVEELQKFIFTYGMIPAEIEQGQNTFTLLTSMFVHGGFAHVFGNMLFLWIFGDNIEQRFGSILYLLFYLGCGLAASYAHIATNSGSVIPSVGASGGGGARQLSIPEVAQGLTISKGAFSCRWNSNAARSRPESSSRSAR